MASYPSNRYSGQSPGRHFGIAPGADLYQRGRGDRWNRYINASWSHVLGALPSGGSPPEASILPLQSGGIASTSGNRQTLVNAAANLQQGMRISGTTTLALTNAVPLLLLLVKISGSTTMKLTNASAAIGSSAPISGSATLALTNASALLGASAKITGSATLTLATSSDVLTAKGQLAGAITPFTTLSPENLATAVWASNLEGAYTATQIQRTLLSVAAGKTSITDLGGGLATVKFRDVNDTKDRVVASLDGSERTTVTIDPS